jgi:hypothetical protein
VTTIKENIFRTQLVPAGQLLETMLKLPMGTLHPGLHSFSNRQRLSNDVFDALAIAVCYVVHPHTTDVSKVGAAIGSLIQNMTRVFETITAAGPILETFGVRTRRSSQGTNLEFVKRYDQFLTLLPELCTAIHVACQYEPAKREEWLRSMTSPSTSLTAGGRLNRWRTFVRNLSWETTAALLNVKEKLAAEGRLYSHPLSSDVGKLHAQALWDTVFDEVAKAEVLMKKGTSPTGLVPISEGVTVTMTADRLLEVSCRFNPGARLTKETTESIGKLSNQGKSVPETLALETAPRQFLEKTDVAGLAELVSRATAWLGEQTAKQEKLQLQYDVWVADEKLQVVRSKLNAHFSPEERALLRQALSAEGSTS